MRKDGINRLKRTESLILYGQVDYAARVEEYLSVFNANLKIIKIILPLDNEQPDKAVFDFDAAEQELLLHDKGILVFAAFSLKYHIFLREELQKLGFTDVIYYDSKLDNELKTVYFRHLFAEREKKFIMLNEMHPEKISLEVYMAKHIADKPVKYSLPHSKYIVPIQVGAALTDKRIADVTDDTGDNISRRNRYYSEMTAFYWMWRNAKAEWLGICHYRRHFVNLDDIAEKIAQLEVDALLPIPTLCEHSVHEDYLLRHIPYVWQPMLEVIKEQSLEYYEASKKIFKDRVFYASNMCILRRNVLNDLCSWMFPIVFEIERRVGDFPDAYYNRYAGFCTERLITLYFLYNKHNWRIAHVEKEFIG